MPDPMLWDPITEKERRGAGLIAALAVMSLVIVAGLIAAGLIAWLG